MLEQADFPLNSRGAVYHLDLLPEELGDRIITVGDPNRVSHVSQFFDSIEIKRSNREFVTHTGYLGKHRISVVSTGIGMPNIDIVMNELDALANIDFTRRTIKEKIKSLQIIRIGTTGSLQPEVKTGDVILSDYALGFSGLMEFYKLSVRHQNILDAFKNYGHFPTCFAGRASSTLLAQFSALGAVGITVSCPGFYGPQARQLHMPLSYPDLITQLAGFTYADQRVINMEMETAALYALGENLKHQCLSLNLVIDNRIQQIFAENVEQMMDNFIVKVMEQLSA